MSSRSWRSTGALAPDAFAGPAGFDAGEAGGRGARARLGPDGRGRLAVAFAWPARVHAGRARVPAHVRRADGARARARAARRAPARRRQHAADEPAGGGAAVPTRATRSRPPTAPRWSISRSAATGTTRSRCPTAAWRSASATSSGAASPPRARWGSCGAPCARSPARGCHRRRCSGTSTRSSTRSSPRASRRSSTRTSSPRPAACAARPPGTRRRWCWRRATRPRSSTAGGRRRSASRCPASPAARRRSRSRRAAASCSTPTA